MKIAAILYRPSQGPAVDEILQRVTGDLKARSVKLAGAVQWNTGSNCGPCSDMVLEDLASGQRISVSEDRGPLARGCRLDSSALEEVAGLTSASIRPGVDLVVLNKFSKSEAEGAGLRQVIEAAVVAGLPVLVGLNATHQPAWEAFAGSETQWLPPEETAIRAWCDAILSQTAGTA